MSSLTQRQQAKAAYNVRRDARRIAQLKWDTKHGIKTLGAHSTEHMRDPITYKAARHANPPRSDMGTFTPRQQAFDRTFYVEYTTMDSETLTIHKSNRQPWSCASWAEGFPTIANVRRWLRRNAIVTLDNGTELHRMEAHIFRVDTNEHVLSVAA